MDEDLLVVNKPAGLLSIPDGYNKELPHLRSILESNYGALWIVHRLDKETSGLIVLARNVNAHRNLNESFRLRLVGKKYHGLVTPVPEWREMNILLPLKTDADRKHRTRVNYETGKDAHSICRVLKRFDTGVLMEIQIMTGLTHQIRAHLRSYGLMILGENLYNAGLPDPHFYSPRTMLHARELTFNHPTTGKYVQFIAQYPEDFQDAYTKLRFTIGLDGEI